MDGEQPGIESAQKDILASIHVGVRTTPCEEGGILWELACVDEKTACLAFGKLGEQLREFSLAIDRQHPDLRSICSGELAPGGNLSNRLCEILELCKYAQSRGMTESLPFLRKASGYGLPKELKSIDSPRKSNRWIRFLLEGQEELRKTKKSQEVSINRDRLVSMWNGAPDDFSLFMRYDEQYRKEVAVAEEQAKRYEQLGCPSNARIIREEINKFVDKFSNCHYGFHRITVMETVIILAKMYGAELQVEKLQLGSSEPPYIEFAQIASWDLERFVRDGIESRSLSPSPIAYGATVFPIHYMPFPSENMEEVVNHLDHCPGFGGRAVFDHLLVVWPRADLSARFELGPKQDSRVWDVFQEEAYDCLLRERKLVPVLLGERDGKCYFICYWM